jgi:site-specific DNA-methyltransferase (adenine-specific)
MWPTQRPLGSGRGGGVTPYYSDDFVTIYHGDNREVFSSAAWSADAKFDAFDLILTDPPYGETSLRWDRIEDQWIPTVSQYAPQLWCFGSMRYFLNLWPKFDTTWRFAQDVVWEKHTGSNMAADRFRRVHEHVLHFYRHDVDWGSLYHVPPRVPHLGPNKGMVFQRGPSKGDHLGASKPGSVYVDDGTRIMRSVMYAESLQRSSDHPTQKPLAVVSSLVEYSTRIGDRILDPFMGSGTTLVAAKMLGRKAVGIEVEEKYCELAARRCSQESFGWAA